MFDTHDKNVLDAQSPSQGVGVTEGQTNREVAIPAQRLLHYYRHHLTALRELTDLLGADTLSGFGDELQQLASLICKLPEVRGSSATPAEESSAARETSEDQRPEIKALIQSVQRNPDSIRRMSNLPEIVLIAAVDRMGTAIKHIANPSEAVQMAAVKRNPWAIKRIKRPTATVMAYALEKAPELKQHFDRLDRARRNRLPTLDEDDHQE